MAKKTGKRKEHSIHHDAYARKQLKLLGAAMGSWLDENKIIRRNFAASIGCTANQIMNVERGYCFPSFPLYVAICREMGQEPLPLF